jgi:hypothetical protein
MLGHVHEAAGLETCVLHVNQILVPKFPCRLWGRNLFWYNMLRPPCIMLLRSTGLKRTVCSVLQFATQVVHSSSANCKYATIPATVSLPQCGQSVVRFDEFEVVTSGVHSTNQARCFLSCGKCVTHTGSH